jgi:hypothetical protein
MHRLSQLLEAEFSSHWERSWVLRIHPERSSKKNSEGIKNSIVGEYPILEPSSSVGKIDCRRVGQLLRQERKGW